MHEDLLNILSDSNKDIDNQKLMDYISGKLSAEQKHEVEKWMIDNPFFNEAVEGLQNADSKKVSANVDEINAALRKYLKHRKVRREKNIFPVNMWTYVAVFFILVLAVVVYLILHYMRR
jgi:anti-sigma factor RsiW